MERFPSRFTTAVIHSFLPMPKVRYRLRSGSNLHRIECIIAPHSRFYQEVSFINQAYKRIAQTMTGRCALWKGL